MSNFSDIKRRLSMSTTMPDSIVTLVHNKNDIDQNNDDDECDEDHTNPTGGCGCC